MSSQYPSLSDLFISIPFEPMTQANPFFFQTFSGKYSIFAAFFGSFLSNNFYAKIACPLSYLSNSACSLTVSILRIFFTWSPQKGSIETCKDSPLFLGGNRRFFQDLA